MAASEFKYGKTDGDSTISRFILDDFWSQRITTVAKRTLPSMHDVLKKTGRWDFFDFNWKSLDNIVPHHFWDSDIAKFLEAVCFSLKYTDKNSEVYQTYLTWIDDITRMAKKAQEEDGYLNSFYSQLREKKDRFADVMEMHELYCCGHLIEAAVALYEATGSKELINVMCKYLDLICKIFGPEEGQKHGYPGHEEIELALLKLLKVVPEEKYFKLLDYFVEQRGYKDGEFFDDQLRQRGLDPLTYRQPAEYDHMEGAYTYMFDEARSYWYYQAHKPIREQKEALGHSVRLAYYLTGAQGLANLKNDESLKKAVTDLFNNIVDKKFYIHGGIGAISRWEGFGEDYDLRWDGYSETCASLAMLFLCEKMLADKLDRKVALAMERSLYNDVLGGVSIDGDAYYYNQPISGEQGLSRQSWFVCACCPPNVARTFSSLEKYTNTVSEKQIAIHLYVGVTINTSNMQLKLSTKYPLDGTLKIQAKSSEPVSIAIREPNTKYQVSTSDYTSENGYLIFPAKKWNETFEIKVNIPVEVIVPDPNVKANAGHLAVERGPFVYVLEKSRLGKELSWDEVKISRDQIFEESLDLYHNAEYVKLSTTLSNGTKATFVPYFVHGNLNPGEDFRTWIKEDI